ncbi:MAG: sodium:proton antiporter [Planctomycetota bacterium]|nr:sodium:proton antiporter [Planctomycetota bacterium]
MDATPSESALHQDTVIIGIVLLGCLAQWLAWRWRLPSILVLLATGLAVGPVGLGVIDPANLVSDEILFAVVSCAVAVILFEGGLSLRLNEFKRGGVPLKRLLWIGVPVAWLGGASAFAALYGGSLELALLVGAILVVTGPTVIGPLLKQVQPVGRAGPIAKWEGILNDPIGAVLAVLMVEVVLARGKLDAWGSVVLGLLVAAVVAIAGGLLCAWVTVTMMRRGWLPDHLHGVATLAITLGLFMLSNAAQSESGLLAVTVYGAALANQSAVSVRHVTVFNEHLRTFLISVLFIVLAARFTPEQVAILDWRVFVFLALLVLLIRPLCVLSATIGTTLNWRERTLLAWMAPRGIVAAAVASLFALELSAAGVPGAELVEPLLYAVIVGTVLVYGLGARPLAGLLGLRADSRGGVLFIGAHGWARALARTVRDAGYPVQLIDSDRGKVAAARLDGLPAETFNVLSNALEDEGEGFPGIDCMLALTASDEANALAAIRYAEHFGREHVYQLAGTGGASELAQHLSGRVVGGGKLSFAELQHRFGANASGKVTALTESYSLEDYRRENGSDVWPAMVIGADGRFEVVTDILRAGPGDSILALTVDRPPA